MSMPDPPGNEASKPANDNADDNSGIPLDPRIREIARAIGRHIAREQARNRKPANDNRDRRSD